MRPHQILSLIRSQLVKVPNDDSDSELLRRFISLNDHDSFAKLLDRYAGMVMGVCRRVVGETHLAEDVFQATFLVLSKKAKSLRETMSLPAWLHRVAFRLALRTRKSMRSRQPPGVSVERIASSSPLDELSARELLAILDEELNRLPETHRTALILCCLEGHSQEEAAHLLGCSPGSIKGRLERGRNQLRDRLTKRGLIFSAIVGIPLVIAPTGFVSAAVLQNTLALLTPGHSIEPTVAALVEAFMRTSVLVKLKVAGLSLLLVCGVGFGAVTMYETEQPAVETKAPQPAEIVKAKEATADADRKKDLYNDPLPDGAVMRLGTIQRRAVGAQMAMTADGKSIISVRGGKYVTVFDAETGERRETRTLLFDSSFDRSVLSPDGKWLAASGDEDPGRLILVNLQSGKLERKFAVKDSRYISSIALSRRGDRVAAGCYVGDKRVVRVWDMATGKDLLSEAVTTEVDIDFVDFTPDGKGVIADFTDVDIGLMCWEVETNKLRWQAKNCHANRAIFTPDGQFMLASSRREFNAVDVTTGQLARIANLPELAWDCRLRFLPDGKRGVMSKEGGIVVWDRENGRELRFLKGAGEEFIVAPDGKTIVSNDGSLQRWNLDTGKPIYANTFDLGHIHEVIAVKFTADGKLLVSASKDGTVRLWDALTGKPLHVWPGHQAFRPSPVKKWAEAGVQALDISPDGRWIVSAGSEEKLIVRDVKTGDSRSIELPKADRGEMERHVYHLRSLSGWARGACTLRGNAFYRRGGTATG